MRGLHNYKRIISATIIIIFCLTFVLAVKAEPDAEPLTEPSMGSLQPRREDAAPAGGRAVGDEAFSDVFLRVTADLTDGFRFNGIIFSVTLLLALPFGMIVAFGLISKFLPLKWFCKTIVWIVRGSPLLLQLYIVFFLPGWLHQAGVPFFMPMRDRLLAALIAFAINYSMYFAEIYRGALENMPKGQFEAGKVLGLSKWQVFFHVILFQVIKNITAPIGNEVITLVKDTSLARVIGVFEILMRAQGYANLGTIWPLFYTLVFYLAATAVVTLVFEYFERRLKRAVGE